MKDKIEWYYGLDYTALDIEVHKHFFADRSYAIKPRYTVSMEHAWEIVIQMRTEEYATFRNMLLKCIRHRTQHPTITYADLVQYMEPVDICIAAILTVKESDG